jgi:hypothetical protein
LCKACPYFSLSVDLAYPVGTFFNLITRIQLICERMERGIRKDNFYFGRLLLAPQGQDSTLAISVGGTTGMPLSLSAQLGYAGTNAR